jgi:hypothetical protein
MLHRAFYRGKVAFLALINETIFNIALHMPVTFSNLASGAR